MPHPTHRQKHSGCAGFGDGRAAAGDTESDVALHIREGTAGASNNNTHLGCAAEPAASIAKKDYFLRQ